MLWLVCEYTLVKPHPAVIFSNLPALTVAEHLKLADRTLRTVPTKSPLTGDPRQIEFPVYRKRQHEDEHMRRLG